MTLKEICKKAETENPLFAVDGVPGEVIEKAYLDAGWKHETCGACRGTGQVASYSWADFEGPTGCKHCDGQGSVWITPSGKNVQYPGGKFC